jgi:hypothetical protein
MRPRQGIVIQPVTGFTDVRSSGEITTPRLIAGCFFYCAVFVIL